LLALRLPTELRAVSRQPLDTAIRRIPLAGTPPTTRLGALFQLLDIRAAFERLARHEITLSYIKLIDNPSQG
jgi:hypothetical protein